MKIYVSHSIRGKWGKEATLEQMTENCQKAIKFGNWLKKHFPDVIFYVPADHDEFVTIAYVEKFITEDEILEVDCQIIKHTCQGLIFYMPDDFMSKGMNKENTCAEKIGLPILNLPSHILGHEQMLKYCITNWLDYIKEKK